MAEESARHRLFRKLEAVLGPEEAATLMEHLHPSRWDELAMKADLESLATKKDLESTSGEVRGLSGEVRGLSGEVRGLRTEMGAFRETVDARFEATHQRIEASENRIVATIRGEMSTLVTAQTRTIMFALVGAITANAMLVLGAVRLP